MSCKLLSQPREGCLMGKGVVAAAKDVPGTWLVLLESQPFARVQHSSVHPGMSPERRT